jgi:hypothetical protein
MIDSLSKSTFSAMILSLCFLNCAGYQEPEVYEYVTTLEDPPCPDRNLFESDFQYNSSLTKDIIERCKIKDISRSGISIALRKARLSETQGGVINE